MGLFKLIRQYLPIIVGGLMVFGYQNCAPVGDSLYKSQTSDAGSAGTETPTDEPEEQEIPDTAGAPVDPPVEPPVDPPVEPPIDPPVEPPPPPPPPPTELICLTPGAPTLENPNKLEFTVFSGHGSTDSGHNVDQSFTADLGGTSYGSYLQLTSADNDRGLDNVDGVGTTNAGTFMLPINPDGQRTCESRQVSIDVQVGANCTLPANEAARESNIINITVNVINACMANSLQTGPGIAGQPQFGHDSVIEGSRVAVASIRDSSDGGFNSYHGSVHVYNRSGENMTLEQRLVPSDIAAGDADESRRNGGTLQAIALSGDVIAAGLPRSGNRSGAVYIFTRSAGVWSQTARILPPATSNQAYFGQSVALEGNKLVVGAMEEDMGGVARGAAYVYIFSSSWNLTATLSSNDASPMNFEHFGESVAIDAGNIVVGAPFSDLRKADGKGSVYYYPSGNYTTPTKVSASAALIGGQFGKSVDISGGRIIIGAPSADGGNAFIFNTSNLANASIVLDKEDGDFGADVAIDGNEVLVGARKVGTSTGAAFYFDLNLYAARKAANGKRTYFQLSGSRNNEQFGSSVAIDNGYGVMGAPLAKVGIFNQSGSVSLYRLTSANYN